MSESDVQLDRSGHHTRLSVDLRGIVDRMSLEERLELAAELSLSGEVCKQVLSLVLDRYPENGDWLSREAVERARQEIWDRADATYRDSVQRYAESLSSASVVQRWYTNQLFRMERMLRASLHQDEKGYYYYDQYEKGVVRRVNKDHLATVPPMGSRGSDFGLRDKVLELLGMVPEPEKEPTP